MIIIKDFLIIKMDVTYIIYYDDKNSAHFDIHENKINLIYFLNNVKK